MNRKISNALLVLAMLWIPAACDLKPAASAEETLQAMGVEEAAFSELKVCDQVRLFADVGGRGLDSDHAVVAVPAWIDQPIDEGSRSLVADCIGKEGLYRIGLLRGGLIPRDAAIRAVHALLYKAREISMIDTPMVRRLVHAAVCEDNLDPANRLLSIYWYGTRSGPPGYVGAVDEDARMHAELCNQ